MNILLKKVQDIFLKLTAVVDKGVVAKSIDRFDMAVIDEKGYRELSDEEKRGILRESS